MEAVFGRSVLHEYEMDAMRMSLSIANSYHARAASKEWAEWDKTHPEAAELLDWAAEAYKCQA